MTINITIESIFLVFLAILVAMTIFSIFEALYYKRLAVQMKWRVAISKVLSEQIKKIKKENKLTQKQKGFLNFVLNSAHSNKIILPLSLDFSKIEKQVGDNEMQELSQMSQNLGIEYDSELFLDIGFLMLLCMLHASTHSFFFGFRIRDKLISMVLDSQESVEAVVKEPTKKSIDFEKIISHKNNLPYEKFIPASYQNVSDRLQTA